jgi:hypothetical protein
VTHEGLLTLLRAARTPHPNVQILVAGSQSVRGALPDSDLPERATLSLEADVMYLRDGRFDQELRTWLMPASEKAASSASSTACTCRGWTRTRVAYRPAGEIGWCTWWISRPLLVLLIVRSAAQATSQCSAWIHMISL